MHYYSLHNPLPTLLRYEQLQHQLQPLDSVLVRVQAGAAGNSSLPAAIKGLSSSGGIRAFWRGAAPMLWSVPAQNALLFAGYGAGLGWCSRGKEGGQQDVSPSLWHVFAGGCAGGFAQVSALICCVSSASGGGRYLCTAAVQQSGSPSHTHKNRVGSPLNHREIGPQMPHKQRVPGASRAWSLNLRVAGISTRLFRPGKVLLRRKYYDRVIKPFFSPPFGRN